MSHPQWNQRFFASTRGRVVMLLRRASRTVDELAQALDLTDNAVRAHLAALERDGFVQQHGARRGSSKPAYVYDLLPEAEQLFPKIYAQVLRQLLEVLNERMTPAEVEDLMRTAGRRIATSWQISPNKLETRLQQAVAIFNEIGGLTELETSEGNYVIKGYSCPLASAVANHPEVCRFAEALLTELVGIPVQEHCGDCAAIQCYFSVPIPE
jgi:predicted ArsR family transcriptional regulator